MALLDPASRFVRRVWGREADAGGKEAKALAEQAMAQRRAGDWVSAERTWRRAVALSPANTTWRFRAVEAAARAGRADDAAAWARSIDDDAPAKTEAVLHAVEALIDAGKPDEATAVLQRVAGHDPERAWALALQARLRQVAGDAGGALRLAQEAAAMPDASGRAGRVLRRAGLGARRAPAMAEPEPAPAAPEVIPAPPTPVEPSTPAAAEAPLSAPWASLYARVDIPAPLRAPVPRPAAGTAAQPEKATIDLIDQAERELEAGKAEAARVRLKHALSRDPNSARAAHALARASRALNDEEAALAWLRAAVRLDPTAARPRLELARQLMRPGLYDQALREWQVLYAAIQGSEPLVQIARSLQRLGAHAAAVQAYELLGEVQPHNVEARLGRARSLQAMGSPEAQAAWRSALELEPASEEAAVMLARSLGDAGDHAGAIAVVEAALGQNTASDRLLVHKAKMLLAAHEPQAAIEILKELSARQPEVIDWHVELGRACRSANEPELAVQAWRRVLALRPDHAEAVRALAGAYEKLGDLAAAQAVWEERRAAGAETSEVLIQLARVQHKRGLQAEAGQTYLRAAEIAPDEVRVVIEAARYLSRSRATLFEGEALADRWIALAPHSADAYLCRSGVRLRMGRTAEGEADLDRALEADPQSLSALSTKARRLAAEQRWAQAEPVARAWREASGNGAEATEILARTLFQQGRTGEAETLYREQHEANPSDIRAVLAVADFCLRDRNLDEAVSLWREALAIDPASPRAWSELVINLANADREAEALEMFSQAQANMGDDPDALLSYALMMDRGRFLDRVDAAFARAIEAAPGTAAAPRAYGRFLARDGRLGEALKAYAAAREAAPQDWELALEMIDVMESLAVVGHPDPAAVVDGPDLGALMPERLYDLVVEAAREIEVYKPRPRTVALVTQALGAGGAERQLAATARGLAGHPQVKGVFLSCLPLDPKLQRDFHAGTIREAGVPIYEATPDAVAASFDDPVVQRFRPILERLPRDMGPVGWWLAQFREMRPEVVHIWQDMTALSVAIAAVLAGVPRVLLGTRSVRPDNPRRRLRRWMRHGYRRLLTLPTVGLMNNSLAGGADYADWLGIEASRVQVVYNGLELEALRKDAGRKARARIRKQLGVPADAPLVGGVFRMSEEKRPMLWAETAALVAKARPDAHFVVCGAGPFYDDMAAYAEKHGFAERMHLPGVQSQIGAWFSAMDIVLLTSRHEGLPNVLIEAQSLGVPVVVPAVGGAPETLIEGETGFAIPKATARQMATRIVAMIEDEAWRERAHAAASHFIAERFSLEGMVAATLGVYFGEGAPTRARGDAVKQAPKPPARKSAPKAKPKAAKTPAKAAGTSKRRKAAARPAGKRR